MAIPKNPDRDWFRDEIDKIRPDLPPRYVGVAVALNPTLIPKRLQQAVNRRTVYKEALPTLQAVAMMHRNRMKSQSASAQ